MRWDEWYDRSFIWLLCSSVLWTLKHTHTQPFYGSLDFVRDNPGEPVPEETFTHSHSSWSSNIPICFLHLLRSMASSLFNPRALQSFFTISLQVFFGLPLSLAPSTSYSIYFFTQSLSSFHNTCPYHRNLFGCSTEIMPSNSLVYLSTLYLELSLVASCHTPILPFLSLPSEVPPQVNLESYYKRSWWSSIVTMKVSSQPTASKHWRHTYAHLIPKALTLGYETTCVQVDLDPLGTRWCVQVDLDISWHRYNLTGIHHEDVCFCV